MRPKSKPLFVLFCFSFTLFLLIYSSGIEVQAKEKINLKEFSFGKNQKFKAGFDGGKIVVQIQPSPGEGIFRFATWTLRDWRNNYKKIIKFNKSSNVLKKNRFITFPFNTLNDNMQSLVLQSLFAHDSGEEKEWAHRVKFRGETISLIAGVFAKREISAQKIITYNKLKDQGTHLMIGDVVHIPWDWVREELNLRPIEVKAPLKVKLDQFGKRYAYYKIKKGESLYSSVVIRFTGRTLVEDVNDMANKLLVLNHIKDEHFVLVGSDIKIPLEWLSEEYLIKKVPLVAKPEPEEKLEIVVPKKIQPIHIIIDPGHGGKDPGAIYGSVKNGDRIYEDETVYDVGLRLAEILKSRNFVIHTTLQDPNQLKPIKKLAIVSDSDEKIMVNPPYLINHVRISINMRVFLINKIYQDLIRKKIPGSNIIMISLHGDALHKSLQGATVYFPDARLRAESFSKINAVYKRRKEYRKLIKFPVKDNSWSAILSSNFGKEIIRSFKQSGLKTHKSFAVRGYYYRKGKRTLPAILRYSKIPTSVLVEIGNLNNASDRAGLRKPEYRQKIAAALADAIQRRFKKG
jgi:N-acetylmuramoyl-L-alanine amidase